MYIAIWGIQEVILYMYIAIWGIHGVILYVHSYMGYTWGYTVIHISGVDRCYTVRVIDSNMKGIIISTDALITFTQLDFVISNRNYVPFILSLVHF